MSQSKQKRLMRLGAFVHETGQHVAAWRHPQAHMQSGTNFAEMVETAQLAERGKFDLLFLADSAAVNLSGSADVRGRMGKVVKFEPMTILSALAAVTKNLGLVATSTTTFNEPYTLARQFASLDQISGGRSGWNLVTSNNEQDALNYSREEHLSHSDRYDRAIEFADVVNGLWDSWDEDAFIRDKEGGRVLRSGEDACAEPQRDALPGARAAQRRLLAAGPAGAGPGRRLGHRTRRRRAARRAGLHRGHDLRAGQGVL